MMDECRCARHGQVCQTTLNGHLYCPVGKVGCEDDWFKVAIDGS
jgi:hypothetical protein